MSTELTTVSKPSYGLIRHPKPKPPHECKVPGLWIRFFYFIIGHPVREGSMFRCKDCSKIYKLQDDYDKVFLQWKHSSYHEYDWAHLGGAPIKKLNE